MFRQAGLARGRHTRMVAATAASVALVVGAAACGDDDDDAEDTEQTAGESPTSAAPQSTEDAGAAPSSSEGSEASDGEPIKIGTVGIFEGQGFSVPELRDGVQVAVDSINADGGIDGRPIEFVPCDDKFEAASAAACFRQFADDEDVVALVGAGSAFSEANLALLEESGLTWIGSPGTGKAEESHPNFVLIASQATTEFRGMGMAVGNLGGQTAAIMRLANPQADGQEANIRAGAEVVGVEITNVVPVEVTAVDLSAAAAQLQEGNPDAVILGGLETQMQAVIKLLRTNGYEGDIVVPTSQTRPAFVEALGADAEGVVGVAPYAPVQATEADAEGLEMLRADVQEFKPDTPLSGYTTNGWLATHLFAETVRAIDGEVTRESIATAVRSLTAFDTMGLTPGSIDFTQTGPLPDAPNLVNVAFTTVVGTADGTWAWDGVFYDGVTGEPLED